MTRKRIEALQWFHDRGEVTGAQFAAAFHPTREMAWRMDRDGQLKAERHPEHYWIYSLTDKGRQDLHEATR